MYRWIFLLIAAFLMGCHTQNESSKELAGKILADEKFQKVDAMARELMKKGFYAGSGYQMVWSRDLNTFIELSCDEYDNGVIRENLLLFFHFQQENGELLDGYVPREAFTWHDPNTYESETAPGHIGFKNTVETDQETSLIQAIYKYIRKTGDRSILTELVAGKTVSERMRLSIDFLLNERYSAQHQLITGATTFDWGDVQVEGGAVVDTDSLTHWSIDVYDNAMLAIACQNLSQLTSDSEEIAYWKTRYSDLVNNIRKYLWDAGRQKFIPHVYISASPFPAGFDENEIFYHGGTAVAIEAGVLTSDEIAATISHFNSNVQKAGAQSVGLTVFPAYPQEVLGKGVTAPYEYQNGGDWTWFGGRLIQQLIANGYVREAYVMAQPMMERVISNDGFYEWYTLDGSPMGSADFKGSAGVLARSIEMFYEWAEKNK
ncbi:GH36-type glycosyl hydrolase domain-containing protein [Carboxylicivirga sp. RSCT41]|uniref:GH36-type glycosyl hydrolase domain-containing protein n=1 Tax=Carboxylicivirga agarovorans TaxID=3417570 RepID=UPI003D34561A